MRKCHKLKSNKKSEFPRHVIFFDVESELIDEGNIIKHEPYLVIANYIDLRDFRKQNKIFYEVEKFWEWIINKIGRKEKYWVFAHNITYDFVTSRGFNCLDNAGYKIDNFYEEGRTFILKFIKNDKAGKRISTIEIINVGNFYSGSVAGLGKAFNLPKMDYDVFQKDIEKAIPYCQRDVDIIEKAMLTWFEFCKENDLGNFAKTVPGQAFNAFRHRFLKPYEILIHDNEVAIELERKSYYGGRTECFKIGNFSGEEYFYVDVNSMYPYVMKNFEYPYKLMGIKNNVSISNLYRILEKNLVCAEVEVNTEIPVFPYRKGKIIFPVGEFTTYLTTNELLYGIENNLITKIKRISIYKGAKIFEKYVDFFYKKRLESKAEKNKVNDLLYKLMLNSLYGKTGQLSGGWKKIGKTELKGAGYEEIYDLDAEQYRSVRWINGILFEKLPLVESYNSFPAIAGHVTGNARMQLFDFMQKAGMENIFYCDTDSLFVNEKGYQNLFNSGYIDAKVLGKLKLEESSKNLTIYSPKDYIFGENVRHKGVKDNDEYLGNNTWRQIVWPKISSLIRANNLNEYYNVRREKRLKRTYDKGYLKNKNVYPLRMKNNKILMDSECENHELLKKVWR